MPNSKHRKRQIAANRRQLEKARKKIVVQNLRAQESEKENESPRRAEVISERNDPMDSTNDTVEESRWLGGLGSLYSWCQSGLVQVSQQIASTNPY